MLMKHENMFSGRQMEGSTVASIRSSTDFLRAWIEIGLKDWKDTSRLARSYALENA